MTTNKNISPSSSIFNIQHSIFKKNDAGFICANCGTIVPPLITSSRDHCTECLCSLHVDINPGDRANSCCGIMRPVGVRTGGKKSIVIEFKCDACHAKHNCRAAADDSFEKIVELSTYNALLGATNNQTTLTKFPLQQRGCPA